MPPATETSPHFIGFLLVPNFTMLAFSSAIEPLRMANQLAGRELFCWTTISEDGEPVQASDGVRVATDCGIIQGGANLDTLFVCGGIAVGQSYTPTMLKWLRYLATQKVKLGGICTGSYLLAKAGLLDNYVSTIHWEYLPAWREEFPKVKSCNNLFIFDRDRVTCTGGTAPIDMMLSMISKMYGRELSAAISNMFICERIRDSSDVQKVPLRHLVGDTQPKLLDVVAMMEANLEEPISLGELADYVHLSRRQLERLFQKYLHCSPSRYYLQLRLTRARQLLKQTNLSIIEVATACGFVSTPHFSKCYRNCFSVPPRDERLGCNPNGPWQKQKSGLKLPTTPTVIAFNASQEPTFASEAERLTVASQEPVGLHR